MTLLNLQPSALGLSAVLLALVFAAATWGVGRVPAINRRATQSWAWTLVTMALSLVCWSWGRDKGFLISFLLGNTLVVLCSVLFLRSMCCLVGQAVHVGCLMAQFVVGVSGIVAVLLASAPRSYAVVSIALSFFFAATGALVVLSRHRKIRASVAGWVLIACLGAVCLFFVAFRLLVLAFGGGAEAVQPMAATQVQGLALWAAHLIVMVASLSYMWVLFEQRREALRARSQLDELTGVLSRSAFLDSALKPLEHAMVYSVAVLDVDQLDTFNERFGRALGDAVLQHVTAQAARGLRGVDLIGRFGGDEFCILLPHGDEAQAQAVSRHICQAVAANPLQGLPGPELRCSVSIGVATAWVPSYLDSVTMPALQAAIQRASDAMCLAKSMGGQQVQVVHAGAFDAHRAQPYDAGHLAQV